MSLERVRQCLAEYGFDDRIREFDVSSATVELAARALSVEPARIAKTLSFKKDEGCLLVVTAGDMKVDNKKFKETFGIKAKMPSPDEVEDLTGYCVGGVCPFSPAPRAEVYLDESLLRFDRIYPAAGTASSAVELSCVELFLASGARGWVDVCKPVSE